MKNHLTKIITIIVATLLVFVNCQVKDDVAKYKKLYEKAEASVNAELEAQEKHALEENLRQQEEEKQRKEQEKKKQDEQAKREEQERKEKEEANKADQAEKKKQEEDAAAERARKEKEQAEKDKAQNDASDQKAKEDEAEKAKKEEKERKEKEEAEKKRQQEEEKKKQDEQAKRKEQERKEKEEANKAEQAKKDKEQEEKEEAEKRRQQEEQERERREREEQEHKNLADPDTQFLEEFKKIEAPKNSSILWMNFTGQRCVYCEYHLVKFNKAKGDIEKYLSAPDAYVIAAMHSTRLSMKAVGQKSPALYSKKADNYMSFLEKHGLWNYKGNGGVPKKAYNTFGTYKERDGEMTKIRKPGEIRRFVKVERSGRNISIRFTASPAENYKNAYQNKKVKLMLWLLEDNIRAYQIKKGDNYLHNNVFRDELSQFRGDDYEFGKVYTKTASISTEVTDEKIQDAKLYFILTDAQTGQVFDVMTYKFNTNKSN